MLFTGLVILFALRTDLFYGLTASHWPTTIGTVEENVIEYYEVGEPDRRVGIYKAVIVYRYSVNEKLYYNNKITYRDSLDTASSPEELTSAFDNYLPGTKVTVYYNPLFPKRTMLIPAQVTQGNIEALILSLICLILGLLFWR